MHVSVQKPLHKYVEVGLKDVSLTRSFHSETLKNFSLFCPVPKTGFCYWGHFISSNQINKLNWQSEKWNTALLNLPAGSTHSHPNPNCFTHLSGGWFPFLLDVFWLDILFGCPPVLPSDGPSLKSLACLKSPCPAPRPGPPPLPPPRPRWFGCLREFWGLAVEREKANTKKKIKLWTWSEYKCKNTNTHRHTHNLTKLNLILGHGQCAWNPCSCCVLL